MTALHVLALLSAAVALGCDSAGSCTGTPASWTGWDGGVDLVGSDASLPVRMQFTVGARVGTISAEVEPAEEGRLPERLPWFSIFDVAPERTFDTVGTAFDESTSAETYRAPHSITLAFDAGQWSAVGGHVYSARFVGEGGVGAVPGLSLVRWTCAP